jgi:O-antigen chain-terminating methyltransferase
MGWIREEAKRRQVSAAIEQAEPQSSENPTLFSPKQEAQWNRIRANLNLAEENSQAGMIVPELGRFRGVTRKLARLVARGLLYVARVVTNSQRKFNIAALASVRDLHYVFRQWEQTKHEQLEQDRRTLVDLIVRCRKLEQQVTDLNTSLGEAVQPTPVVAQTPAARPDLDALYLAFEERFRGNRDVVKERLKVYLPLLHNSTVGRDNTPILDIGCGRGEWLELLRDEGFNSRGIDASPTMVDLSRQLGLKVDQTDAVAHLRSLPDASLGGVTGFHIIEHLPLEILIALLDETVRVLKPGGLALFETPNPENILVGSHDFYLDPTHIKPLPSLQVHFLAEQRGLSRVEIFHLNPPPAEKRLSGSEIAERFNHHFYGPRDYAVIGWRL